MELKSKAVATVCIGILALVVVIALLAKLTPARPTYLMSDLILSSPAFAHDSVVPVRYTCDGKGINPPLAISGVPKGTVSLVLTIEDPDAPAGVWNHWVVYDMDPSTTAIPEGASLVGTEGLNSSGTVGYEGPCPPSGSHRYVFTLYALDIRLGVPRGATMDVIKPAMGGHIIGESSFASTYSRVSE